MKTIALFLSLVLINFTLPAQNDLDEKLPVRGFSINAPSKEKINIFIKLINEVLAPQHVNTLLLRVDYNYEYESHPELRDENPLSKEDVKKIVNACKQHSIRIVPQINLLGHQSWHSELVGLLRVYPEFDETPHVKLPENYVWPNDDGLYCKSYCPLHPDVHKIVFELIDEITEVFETDAYHAGMDEVFYIGDDKCPRCGGRDKAELFAGEVTHIHNHLALTGKELWIWGDRLIDGKTTGLGIWEASFNNTHRAIDLIPKDVVICDWHYERPDPTAVIFAMKGFRVITCPWRTPEVGIQQLHDLIILRENATPEMKDRYQGMMQTVWMTDIPTFLDIYTGAKEDPDKNKSSVESFSQLFKEINALR